MGYFLVVVRSRLELSFMAAEGQVAVLLIVVEARDEPAAGFVLLFAGSCS
ncbi:MAG: hypothetical protein SXG53_19165 [Pseudomonadota bacterium]|nr:hypothetical protein [Pseudomonadota bacterium]